MWLLVILYSAATLTIQYMGMAQGVLRLTSTGVFIPGDMLLVVSFCLSATIYLAVLVKFYYDYKTRDNTTAQVDNENVAKDRLLIMVICLISTTPCPLIIAIYKSLLPYINSSDPVANPIAFILSYVVFNANFALINCIEEICLLIISKDFRKLVKNQFVRNNETTVVATTVHASQNLQQQRMRQFNIQRNNLVNN
uniref:Serpentine receptor class gamma n=1 Tax=Meloidogyne javanica TaxID=6303 RepID=A0A915MEC9_MELJA